MGHLVDSVSQRPRPHVGERQLQLRRDHLEKIPEAVLLPDAKFLIFDLSDVEQVFALKLIKVEL